MDLKEIDQVVNKYIAHLEEKYPAVKLEPGDLHWHSERLSHVHWMLHEMKGFVKDNNFEKANRWLGFVQGVLWSSEEFDISDLMSHNRSPNVKDKNVQT